MRVEQWSKWYGGDGCEKIRKEEHSNGEKRRFKGRQDGTKFECEEEKEGLDGWYSEENGKVVQDEVEQKDRT